MPSPSESATNSGVRLTVTATLVAAAATGILYLTGAAYFTAYLTRLSAPTLFLDLPTDINVTFGVIVFSRSWFITLLLVLLSVLLAWIARKLGRHWPLRSVETFILAVLLFGFLAAAPVAYHRATADFDGLRTSGFPFNPRVQVYSDESNPLGTSLKQGCYRLLVQTDSRLFLFAIGEVGEAEVILLPLSSIKALSTHRGDSPTGCFAEH